MSLLAVSRVQGSHPPARPTPGIIDRSFVCRRLQRNAIALIGAHPKAELLGSDEMVENLASSQAFEATDLVILRIALGAQRHTLLCIPERVWRGRKNDLLELKRLAGWSGRSCVLVPEAAIQKQPRLNCARAIDDAAGIEVTMEQRMELVMHLVERGKSSLLECASAVTHPSPFTAVLHLVAAGVLKMNIEAPLTPESTVEMADPG